jgi:Holliday junction resolvase-like predicted endonuclease
LCLRHERIRILTRLNAKCLRGRSYTLTLECLLVRSSIFSALLKVRYLILLVKLRHAHGSPYSKGLRAERVVRRRLEEKGWLVRQSKGSRGPYDLYALKGGRKLLVQVKSGKSSFSSRERTKLVRTARKKGATAALARVKGKKVYWRFM